METVCEMYVNRGSTSDSEFNLIDYDMLQDIPIGKTFAVDEVEIKNFVN